MRELLHPTNLLLPAMPLHELTHAAVGKVVGADVNVGVDDVGAFATFRWPTTATKRDVRLAHLAPTIVGVVIGSLLGALAFFTLDVVQAIGYLSADVVRLFGAVYITTNWIVYSWPGPQDRDPF